MLRLKISWRGNHGPLLATRNQLIQFDRMFFDLMERMAFSRCCRVWIQTSEETFMSSNNHGTCGTCDYFGDGIEQQQLIQIRINPESAPEAFSACAAPRNAEIRLAVGPRAGCDAWKPAA